MSAVPSQDDRVPNALAKAAGNAARVVAAYFLLARDWFSPHEPDGSDLEFLKTSKLIGAGRLIVVLFVLTVFGWAALAPLDSAIVTQGVVVVANHRKPVQHLEGGIVRQVLVTDGQSVKRGQVLIRLEDAQARASLASFQGEVDALLAQEARLVALRDGQDHVDFPQSLVSREKDPKVQDAIQGEQSTFKTQRELIDKQLQILGQRSEENETIIAGLKSQQASVERQIALIQQETASVQGLYAQGLSTLPRLLALERQAADLKGQRGQLVEKISQVQMSIGENTMQSMDLRNQNMNNVVKELRDVQTKRFDLMERLGAATDISQRLSIRAPVTGKVVQLTVHAPGAVVKPGETLMEIVPEAETLEVEARVRPEDVESVQEGMPVHANFSGNQRRRLPTLSGVVVNVSADRIVDEHTGAGYFEVTLKIDSSPLAAHRDAKIMPGLPMDVSLETGDRTALEYLIEPITDVFHRGMREK